MYKTRASDILAQQSFTSCKNSIKTEVKRNVRLWCSVRLCQNWKQSNTIKPTF